MNLPLLETNHGPIRHPDCCLGLSVKLLEVLTELCGRQCREASGRKQTVLSIGSGTGLLEALLLQHIQSQSQDPVSHLRHLGVEGVEVQPATNKPHLNKYLPEHAAIAVLGTWETCARLRDPDVSTLLFAYPRQPRLVSQYVAEAALQHVPPASGVMLIVWLGPAADWLDFEPCFRGRAGEELGGQGEGGSSWTG